MAAYNPRRLGFSLQLFADWLGEPGNLYYEAFLDHCDSLYDPILEAEEEEFLEGLPQVFMERIEIALLESFLCLEYKELENPADAFLRANPQLLPPEELRYFNLLRNSVPSLYEIVDVVPGTSITLKDIIRKGEPVKVAEVSASKSLLKWQGIFTRVIQMDDVHLISGTLFEFSPLKRAELADSILRFSKAALRTLPKKARKLARTSDTMLNEVLFNSWTLAAVKWLMQVRAAQTDPALCNTDGEPLLFIEDLYESKSTRKEIDAALSKDDEMFESNEGRWDWFGERVSDPEGQTVRGSLALEDGKLKVSTYSLERADRLRERLGRTLEGLVGEPSRRVKTPDQLMAEVKDLRQPEREFTPEEREKINEHLVQHLTKHYQQTLDEPIPALGNKSPREIVSQPAGKEKVVDWLKDLESSHSSICSPMPGFDFGWMWEELGLTSYR